MGTEESVHVSKLVTVLFQLRKHSCLISDNEWYMSRLETSPNFSKCEATKWHFETFITASKYIIYCLICMSYCRKTCPPLPLLVLLAFPRFLWPIIASATECVILSVALDWQWPPMQVVIALTGRSQLLFFILKQILPVCCLTMFTWLGIDQVVKLTKLSVVERSSCSTSQHARHQPEVDSCSLTVSRMWK